MCSPFFMATGCKRLSSDIVSISVRESPSARIIPTCVVFYTIPSPELPTFLPSKEKSQPSQLSLKFPPHWNQLPDSPHFDDHPSLITQCHPAIQGNFRVHTDHATPGETPIRRLPGTRRQGRLAPGAQKKRNAVVWRANPKLGLEMEHHFYCG